MNKIIFLLIFASSFMIGCKKKERPVTKLVLNTIRTKNQLADTLGSKMNIDPALFKAYLLNNDSLIKLGEDSVTIMSSIMPNTYLVYKDATPAAILKKVLAYKNTFWDTQRKEKAAALGLTPHQVVTMASIVEEETHNNADKGNVASVYINRIKQKMKLGADPTIKFAIDSFQLTRIREKHIKMAETSPYSTYANLGLPPGPICTPSTKTIDAVLNAPKTDYLYFVAQPNFSGLSNFAKEYDQHLKYAAIYHQFLDSLEKARKK
jgi:UPF0755 protein